MTHTFSLNVKKSWLKTTFRQEVQTDSAIIGGKTWSFGVTVLPAGANPHSEKAELMMNVIGPGSVALCSLRVIARRPQHDIVRHFLGKCGTELMHWFVGVDVSLDALRSLFRG